MSSQATTKTTISTENFDGLGLRDLLPFDWQPADIDNAMAVDHANHQTSRALQALAVFEEAPRDQPHDATASTMELFHLEAKIDVLLALVTRLATEQYGMPREHTVIVRPRSLEWTGTLANSTSNNDTGYAVIYPNANLPMPFRIPARVVGTVERSGERWLMMQFENVSASVSDGLEKLIFRRHRRQVALAKGSAVHPEGVTKSETGVFKMDPSEFPPPK